MATLYDLKPRFQDMLRPIADRLAAGGATANQVTIAAAVLSIAVGALLAVASSPGMFLVLPLFLLLRMGLNAIDGMLAREHDQASRLGMFLNEIGDVVSDAALILPFALLSIFPAWGVIAFALLAIISEFAGVLGIAAGASRRYDGPMGKSDRALALAVLAVVVALTLPLPATLAACIFPALAVAALLTTVNRIRKALSQA